MTPEDSSRVTLREEVTGDGAAIRRVHVAAFETTAEADLVDRLRGGSAPVISLVAEVGGVLIGHALLTPVTLDGEARPGLWLALGPMAVVPRWQRRGVGGRLVRRGLELCREAGAAAVFVLGHADYYPRFGFVSAPENGLRFRGPEFDPHFMVLELVAGAVAGPEGEVRYRPEFDAV